MKCEYVQRRLFLYLGKELEPFLSKRIERHLKECPICRNELNALIKTVKLINSISAPPLPRDYSKLDYRLMALARSKGKDGNTATLK